MEAQMKRAARITGVLLIWLITLLEVFGIGAPGAAKLMGDGWHSLFQAWGYPAWVNDAVGVAEVGGALGLLVPRIATFAAVLLALVMGGAVITLLLHPGAMGWGTPLAHVGLLSLIAAARWPRRSASAPFRGPLQST
jgi:uncharacterized membrane protein YphA (DoxX/SURF4 family)